MFEDTSGKENQHFHIIPMRKETINKQQMLISYC